MSAPPPVPLLRMLSRSLSLTIHHCGEKIKMVSADVMTFVAGVEVLSVATKSLVHFLSMHIRTVPFGNKYLKLLQVALYCSLPRSIIMC